MWSGGGGAPIPFLNVEDPIETPIELVGRCWARSVYPALKELQLPSKLCTLGAWLWAAASVASRTVRARTCYKAKMMHESRQLELHQRSRAQHEDATPQPRSRRFTVYCHPTTNPALYRCSCRSMPPVRCAPWVTCSTTHRRRSPQSPRWTAARCCRR